MVALSLIPGAAHIDLGRTIQGLQYFLLFAVCLNGAFMAPFLSSDPDLRLRCAVGAGVARGSKSGAVLVPHKPGESVLWQRVEADEMPPDRPLSAAEKKLLSEWIAAGAPDDSAKKASE